MSSHLKIRLKNLHGLLPVGTHGNCVLVITGNQNCDFMVTDTQVMVRIEIAFARLKRFQDFIIPGERNFSITIDIEQSIIDRITVQFRSIIHRENPGYI